MPEVFAYIADFGSNDTNQAAVQRLVQSWNPAFIVSGGDNMYGLYGTSRAAAEHLFQKTVMDYYGDWINAGKFYPVIGNHDIEHDPVNPTWFREKFPALFGPKNYYSKLLLAGQVEIFCLSSGYRTDESVFEPDGNTKAGLQYTWLVAALAASRAAFRIVILHHPPFTNTESRLPGYGAVRWNFEALGADLVLSGHCHHYERFTNQAIPYVVAGFSGQTTYGFGAAPGTSVQFICHGALRFTVDTGVMTMEAMDARTGQIFDSVMFNTQSRPTSPPARRHGRHTGHGRQGMGNRFLTQKTRLAWKGVRRRSTEQV